jgi:pimeloyl-ACP methyl ester carboxylesterase
MHREQRSITVRDGRRIGVAEYGIPDGPPVFWFHGTPGCRWSIPNDEVTTSRGIRLISLDRPGYGASDAHPERTFATWADDVADCADALGIARFGLAGASGAGPYLCSCAARLSARVTGVLMLGVVAPFDDGSISDMPWLRRLVLWCVTHTPQVTAMTISWLNPRRLPAFTYRLAVNGFPEEDLARLRQGDLWETKVLIVREAFRLGTSGFVTDLALLVQPWGIDFDAIRAPVFLWHGERDRSTPIAMGRRLAREISHAELTVLPDVGHYVHVTHWGAALDRAASVYGAA